MTLRGSAKVLMWRQSITWEEHFWTLKSCYGETGPSRDIGFGEMQQGLLFWVMLFSSDTEFWKGAINLLASLGRRRSQERLHQEYQIIFRHVVPCTSTILPLSPLLSSTNLLSGRHWLSSTGMIDSPTGCSWRTGSVCKNGNTRRRTENLDEEQTEAFSSKPYHIWRFLDLYYLYK